MSDRSIRVVFQLDEGLNPVHWSVYVREDGDLVAAPFMDHVDAFQDWGDAIDAVRVKIALVLIDIGWWA